MNEIATKIKDYLLQQNYQLIESNDENSIIRHQGQVISISSEKAATGFCNVCLPIITDSQPMDDKKMLKLCNAITSKQKVAKAFLLEDCILLAYEFNWKKMDELRYHLKIGIDQVIACKKSIEDAVRLCQSNNMSNHKD